MVANGTVTREKRCSGAPCRGTGPLPLTGSGPAPSFSCRFGGRGPRLRYWLNNSPRRCSLCSAGSAPVSRALGPAGAPRSGLRGPFLAHCVRCEPDPAPALAGAPAVAVPRCRSSARSGMGLPVGRHGRSAITPAVRPLQTNDPPRRGRFAPMAIPRRDARTPRRPSGAPSVSLRSDGAARSCLGGASRRGGAGTPLPSQARSGRPAPCRRVSVAHPLLEALRARASLHGGQRYRQPATAPHQGEKKRSRRQCTGPGERVLRPIL